MNDNMDDNNDLEVTKRAAGRLAHTSAGLETKELGDLGELAFVLTAGAMGLGVSKPFGDCRRYNLIIDSGRRVLRIQVKSVYKKSRDSCYQVNSSRRLGSNRMSYTADEIDFLAAYLAPEDIWYLLPINEILTKKAILLHPAGLIRGRQNWAPYEKYKEAW